MNIRIYPCLVSLAFFILLLSIPAPDTGGVEWWFFRLATLLCFISSIYITYRVQGGVGFLSPPLLLGGLALFLYSLVPALVLTMTWGGGATVPEGVDSAFIRGLPGIHRLDVAAALRGMDSPAEWWVLRFVVLMGLVAILATVGGSGAARSFPRIRLRAVVVLGLAADALALVWRWGGGGIPTEQLGLIQSFGPVLSTVALMLALAAVLRRQRGGLPVLLILAVCSLAQLAINGKIAGLALAVVFLALAGSHPSRRLRLACGLVVLAVPVLSSAGINYARKGSDAFYEGMRNLVEAKLVYRQAETLYCLRFALADDPGAMAGGPLFFAGAVVPRMLWPDKPALSKGDVYAERYCGWPAEEVRFSKHSAAITLLGEPWVHGGVVGMAAALLLMSMVLWAAARLLFRRGAQGIAVLAVLPWLIDFDQGVAIWFAHAVKFGLTAMVISYFLCRRDNKRTTAL